MQDIERIIKHIRDAQYAMSSAIEADDYANAASTLSNYVDDLLRAIEQGH
jgi:hypothetical protein